MTLGFTAYGYSFYLLLSWLPAYLQKQLNVSILGSGYYAAIAWGVATITDLAIGGWLVDTLIKRGYDATKVRKTLFTIGMILGIAVIGAAFTNNPTIAIVWISIALGGLAFAAPIGWSIPLSMTPSSTLSNTPLIASAPDLFRPFMKHNRFSMQKRILVQLRHPLALTGKLYPLQPPGEPHQRFTGKGETCLLPSTIALNFCSSVPSSVARTGCASTIAASEQSLVIVHLLQKNWCDS